MTCVTKTTSSVKKLSREDVGVGGGGSRRASEQDEGSGKNWVM